MSLPQVDLVCAYEVIAGHELTRPDWDEAKNKEVFGKCANPHGHDYRIEIYLSGSVHPETGMVINFYDVDAILQPFIEENLDHKFLNKDVAFFKDHLPTAEWIAVWIHDEIKPQLPDSVTLKKVRVFETRNLSVEYPSA